MEKRHILFVHGFASSARSTKAQYLEERFRALPLVEYHAVDLNPTPMDFEYMTTTGLIDRLRQYVLEHDLGRVSLVGSSYGGLVAMRYAHRFGEVEKMLLLAPSLRWLSGGFSEGELEQWREAGALPVFHRAFAKDVPVRYDLQVDGLRYLDFVPPPCPITIIHGRSDTVAPADDSRQYAAGFPNFVQLVEVDAEHDLNAHLDLIWEYVESFLLDTRARR